MKCKKKNEAANIIIEGLMKFKCQANEKLNKNSNNKKAFEVKNFQNLFK